MLRDAKGKEVVFLGMIDHADEVKLVLSTRNAITDHAPSHGRIDHREAVEILAAAEDSTAWPALVAAITQLCEDPTATTDEIILGLRHPGVVREAAAIELHRRTRRPYLTEAPRIVLDEDDWRRWLAQHTSPNEE